MPSEAFWVVNLGLGMGPLVLGLPRDQIIRVLHDEKLDEDIDVAVDKLELDLDEIDTTLIFSSQAPRSLKRIDVDDERLRIGTIRVHGKPIHEILQLLDVPASETLWCDFFDDEQSDKDARNAKPKSDYDLLKSSTLWVQSLGLGLSLYYGEIETVRLCHPQSTPTHGSGHWTLRQQKLSEDGVDPELPLIPVKRRPIARLLLLGLFIAMGILVLKSIDMQRRWNNAPDVVAKVISVKPPPPASFPDEYTLGYVDEHGNEHQSVFRRMDIYGTPTVGDEVDIRYLPEAPNKPLGKSRFRDVGFEFAVPYGIGIFAIYWILNLLLAFIQKIRTKFDSPY